MRGQQQMKVAIKAHPCSRALPTREAKLDAPEEGGKRK